MRCMKGYVLTALGFTWLICIAIIVIRGNSSFGVYVGPWMPSWAAKAIFRLLISIACLGWLVPLTIGIHHLRR